MGSYLIIVLEDQPQRVIFGEIVPGPVDEDQQLVADTKKSATNHSRRFP
jgi:tRNA A22 N-methylase